jgi:hypothetical protein
VREQRPEALYQADPAKLAMVFNNNPRDHALRNAAEFAEMLPVQNGGFGVVPVGPCPGRRRNGAWASISAHDWPTRTPCIVRMKVRQVFARCATRVNRLRRRRRILAPERLEALDYPSEHNFSVV